MNGVISNKTTCELNQKVSTEPRIQNLDNLDSIGKICKSDINLKRSRPFSEVDSSNSLLVDEKSIEQAKAYVDKNPDTLLVITADHSTGGLTLGAHGQYKWETDVVKGVKATAGTITKALLESEDLKSV